MEFEEAAARRWLSDWVVGLNLCPFARVPLAAGRVRLRTTLTAQPLGLLGHLEAELGYLHTHSETETTLLIHPNALTDFYEYNDFLDAADALLETLGLDGVFQIASFHPDYCFAGCQKNAAENYSNRSPYPMLHLLRESSVTQAVATHPDTSAIAQRNLLTLAALGKEELQRRWQRCFERE